MFCRIFYVAWLAPLAVRPGWEPASCAGPTARHQRTPAPELLLRRVLSYMTETIFLQGAQSLRSTAETNPRTVVRGEAGELTVVASVSVWNQSRGGVRQRGSERQLHA